MQCYFDYKNHIIANILIKHAYHRYRLALDVFDNTDKAVFFLFDNSAIQLLKFPASSIMRMEYDVSMKLILFFIHYVFTNLPL